LPEPRNVAERLRWLRSQTGLTQEEFGRRCEVTKGYISRLESGERENPSDVFLRSCSNAFKVPIEWLENGVGQLPIVDQSPQPDLKPSAEVHTGPERSESQEDLTHFMRVLLEVEPMTSDSVLKLTAHVWDSPDLSPDFKRRLVLGANIAFSEREQQRRPEPRT
jgi:transcriptional regulator with XRE-family HTH domain